MAKDKSYLKLFSDDDISQAELGEIIDEELGRDDPDADLIEMCLDAIAAKDSPAAARGGKKAVRSGRISALRRALVIAAALILLLAGIAGAASMIYKKDIIGGIVEFFDDRIRVSRDSGSTEQSSAVQDSALAARLTDNGIAPLPLPEKIASSACTIKDITYQHTGLITTADVLFDTGGYTGSMVIMTYKDGTNIPVIDFGGAENYSDIQVSGLTVSIFEQNGAPVICYTFNNTTCQILPDCDMAGARELAAGIK